MQIDGYIAELLHDYDCVIVPQLGGFVTNHRPARLDERSGIAHPAQKDLGFNRNLTRSDGLLEQALQKAHGYTFEEANTELRAEVQQYWAKLRKGETLKWQKIGVLFLDTDRNLRFEPSQEINFLKASFGFDAFQMPVRIEFEPIIPAEAEKTVEKLKPISASHHNQTVHRKGRSIYWVAAATMLPFLGMSLYMGLTTEFKSPTDLSLAELFPISGNKKATSAFTPRGEEADLGQSDEAATFWPDTATVFPYSFESEKIDSTGVWINLKKIEIVVEAPANEKRVIGKYHIIAGCFGEEKNAEKFVRELLAMGHGASILDYHKGLYRVSIRDFGDYQQALHDLGEMRSIPQFAQSWMLKKEA